MSYYQDVVVEYLRADRNVFVNTECLIQLDPLNSISTGTHWYCDVVAVNFKERKVYLCEVTYSQTLDALFARLRDWSLNWPAVRAALVRDCSLLPEWVVQPWAFVPRDHVARLRKRMDSIPPADNITAQMPTLQITELEAVVPWKYQTWDRKLTALAEQEEATPSAGV